MSKIANPLRDMKVFGKKIVGFFRDYGKNSLLFCHPTKTDYILITVALH